VTYWFAKAWEAIKVRKAQRAGLVATNSIRGGQNRRVLDVIAGEGRIFEAWSDEPWVLDGAAVRVSIVCFSGRSITSDFGRRLDGRTAGEIYSDLTAQNALGGGLDLTKVHRLRENANVCFQGPVKVGAFNVPADLARKWLASPNPHGRSNSEALRPWRNGRDLTRRPSDKWIIDFGSLSLEAAQLYEAPFEHVLDKVKPKRDRNRDASRRERWWLLGRSGEDLRQAIDKLPRFLLTPRVAKYRVFLWTDGTTLPDSAVVAISREDDCSFGVLHSRFHESWSLRTGTWLGVGNDPRYTPTTTFETFPFPEGLTPNVPAENYASDPRAVAIADAARRLNQLRENWLNPPELVRREPEVVPGFPDRLIPIDARAAAELKKRTLTNLYNQRPAWLVQAHGFLDQAVAAAYGWPADIGEEEALKKLLELNLQRSSSQSA